MGYLHGPGYGGEVSGRGAGQQRGQEAAALHDDGGEVQHEVGEAVQPALLHTVSRGARLGQEPAGENFVGQRNRIEKYFILKKNIFIQETIPD